MNIETDYKLFTAETEVFMYYVNSAEKQIINIIARDLEEAVSVAEEYVKKNHCTLKLINNDCKKIYTSAVIVKMENDNNSSIK